MEPIQVKCWWRYLIKHPKFTGCLINKINNKAWYKNGKRHREDGPASEWKSGYKEWWLNDMRYNSEQDYKIAVRKVKLVRVLKRLDNENNMV